MLKGVCPKCGKIYYGWALMNPIHQTCQGCGSQLEIKNMGDKASDLSRQIAVEQATHTA
jgi:uncharacterized protein (DUF983 family)